MASLTQHGDPHFQRDGRGLGWRGPALVTGAVILGLLLFALLWWRERDTGFYQPPVAPPPPAGQAYEALPEPLPAGEAAANASGMGREDTETANAPHPAVPRPAAPAPRAVEPAPSGTQVATAVPGVDPTPLSSPAPRYPVEALRNGESGTVLLQVEVGADGVPTNVQVAKSSHSRSLDRAASEAVRQWRFHPAQRNGQPAAGSVQVPDSFKPVEG
jgi:protein TonB